MPPKILAKDPGRTSGVLPVNAAQRAAPAKTPAPKLKLVVRRLPPGLTLTEFEEILGDEWKLGDGNVDWREFVPGKVKAPGKQHAQARCSLHLTSEAHVQKLLQKFNGITFVDKAGTHRIPELKSLPPQLQYADNQRTPLGVKQREDSRQGTIDQDPDFMKFLEEQTMAIPKASALETSEKAEIVEVKSTPLIDDLREKKANKAKAATAKAATAKSDKKKEDDKKGSDHKRNASKDAARSEKGGQQAKETARATTKQAASKAAAQQSPAATKTAVSARSKKSLQSPKQQNTTPAQLPAVGETKGPPSRAPNRAPPGQRPKGNADGIKKMLQKDLGIRPKSATASQASAAQPQQVNAAAASSTASTAPSKPAQQARTQQQAQQKTQQNMKNTPSPASAPNQSATKAYLKHANPSQGMTEMLIHQALTTYGPVVNVTIDPRKGTAIAVFKDNDGLKKAMDAKRVTVANGIVEVHQFREGGANKSSAGRGRGGHRGGRTGGGRGSAANAAATSEGGGRGGGGGSGSQATAVSDQKAH